MGAMLVGKSVGQVKVTARGDGRGDVIEGITLARLKTAEDDKISWANAVYQSKDDMPHVAGMQLDGFLNVMREAVGV